LENLKFHLEGGENMGFDYSKLLGRMRELGMTQKDVAGKLGINKGTLNSKLKGKGVFNASEIDEISKILDIAKEEIGVYFFAK
jgi:transcriptional regulator with XRE-family HTH domain